MTTIWRFGADEWVGAFDRAEPPVGALCLWCNEPIGVGEDGELLDGWGLVSALHRECAVRLFVTGSVGHQRKLCNCYGGDEDDPPGMSKREAALAAVLEYELSAPEPDSESTEDDGTSSELH